MGLRQILHVVVTLWGAALNALSNLRNTSSSVPVFAAGAGALDFSMFGLGLCLQNFVPEK